MISIKLRNDVHSVFVLPEHITFIPANIFHRHGLPSFPMVYQDSSILDELQQEAASWKRSLEFIGDENTHLKARLSEIIRDDYLYPQLQDTAAYYHARFVQQDEMLLLLHRDIHELDSLLLKTVVESEQEIPGIRMRHENIRHKMENLERAFKHLKYHFHNDLSKLLQ